MTKEIRLVLLALGSIIPMFIILWWTNSLDYEEELYHRFRERREGMLELEEVERLSYLANDLPQLVQLTIHLKGDDPLPPSLAKLTQVRYLRLVGKKGNNDLSVLKAMPQLEVLKLEEIFADPAQLYKAFAPLHQLKKLYVERCQLVGLPKELAQFKVLEVLSLRNNELRQDAIDWVDWKELTSLKYLDLSHNFIWNIPAVLLQHPQLEYLDLSYNRARTIEVASPPHAVPLKVLRLDKNKLTVLSTGLEHCKALHTLSLTKNRLKHLSDTLPWPEMVDLRLSNNQLTDLPPALENLQQLKTLDLANNYLTELPKAVTTLPNLVYLDLADNVIQYLEVGDTGWEALQYLYIERNELGRLPKRLLKLPALNRIAGEGNALLVEDEWFELMKPRGWGIEDRDLDLVPSWATRIQ